MLFTSKSQYLDRTYYKTYGIKMRSMHGLASYVHPKVKTKKLPIKIKRNVQCL